MVDILSSAGQLTGIGQGAGGGINISLILIFVAVAIFFLIVFAIATFFIVRWWQFKFKIKIYQRINGQFQETAKRRARVILVGKGGDQAIILNKPKKLLPMPSIQSGKNTFLYFISDDGEWINFSFSDFDEIRKEMGATFLDKEMRYARTSLQHMGDERWKERGFFEKYGALIAYSTLILVTSIGLFLVIGQMIKFQQTSNGAAETLNEVATNTNQILGHLDNINSGGSGLQPVNKEGGGG